MKRARLDFTEWLANRIALSAFNALASEPGHFYARVLACQVVYSGRCEATRQARFRFQWWPWSRGLSGGHLTNYRSGYVIVRLT
jgi:hypothetical protein